MNIATVSKRDFVIPTRRISSFVAITLALICLIGVSAGVDANAKAKAKKRSSHGGSHKRYCGGNKLTGTIYNTPHEGDRESFHSYKSFAAAVHIEGSGISNRKDKNGKNMILDYTGHYHSNNCENVKT